MTATPSRSRAAARGPDPARRRSGLAPVTRAASRYHRAVPVPNALRATTERAMRTALLWLSRRRSLGRLATRLPITRGMVARFVAGETLDAALIALERLRAAGFRTTVDVLGEAVTSTEAARAAADQYLETLDALAARGLDRNVSVKLSQMGLGLDGETCRDNVRRILERAAEHDAFVRIDMEDHSTTDATLALWRELRPVNAGRGDSGVVIQAALRRSPADVDGLLAEHARIRLCKGAYVEPAAVAHPDKADVDAAYEELMVRLLREATLPAIATHDERMIRRALAVVRAEGIAPDRFEFQMLYGVRRDLQERLVRAGFRVRVYVPFGTQWYPYFMCLLAERPANVAFVLRSVLREGRHRGGSSTA
jgi:proline dehydrogenase